MSPVLGGQESTHLPRKDDHVETTSPSSQPEDVQAPEHHRQDETALPSTSKTSWSWIFCKLKEIWKKKKKKVSWSCPPPWKAPFDQPISIDSSSASRPHQHLYLSHQHLYLSLLRHLVQPVLTQLMLHGFKNIYCTPSLCHTLMLVRHSSTQRCQTFPISKVPCSGIWPVLSSLSLNSLPGEASLPGPSLWMVREMLCIHATQQPPCQNQVYTHPGPPWDFLALSFSFLQRSHNHGDGGFSIGPTHEAAWTSPAANNCK